MNIETIETMNFFDQHISLFCKNTSEVSWRPLDCYAVKSILFEVERVQNALFRAFNVNGEVVYDGRGRMFSKYVDEKCCLDAYDRVVCPWHGIVEIRGDDTTAHAPQGEFNLTLLNCQGMRSRISYFDFA